MITDIILVAIGSVLVYIAHLLRRSLALEQTRDSTFDALYPVFTRAEIDNRLRTLREIEARRTELWDAIEGREDFRKKPFVMNEELRPLMMNYVQANLVAENLRKIHDIQVEGNAAVVRGSETLASVREKGWDAAMRGGLSSALKASGELEAWVARLSGSSPNES